MPRFVVSACLAGHPCRYDGAANTCPQVVRLVARGEALALCPEQLGGLGTPRPPCEQQDGRVLTRDGADVTAAFKRGADTATRLAMAAGCTVAILKARSPSCGCGCVYDGTFSHTRMAGDGLWAAQLKTAGLMLYTEEALPQDCLL